MATLSEAMAEALARRGVAEPTASLTAELAVAVLRVAFTQWVDQDEARGEGRDDPPADLWSLMRASLDELGAMTATPGLRRRPRSGRDRSG